MKRRTYCQAMKNFKGCITATGLLLLWLCPAILLSQNIALTCPEFEIICTQDDFNCVAEIEIPPLQGSTDCIISSNLSFSYNSASLGSGVVPPEGLIINNAPIGDHQITFEVSDECGNTESCTVSVTVADCGAPLPICINGLAAELMPLNNEVDPDGDGDVDGDGNPDYGALELWALDFIASPNIDCSGPVTYSIHREGEEPDRSIQSIIVTCSDPSPLLLRIYAWDNAFNPYSVQPDGTVGGPNYDFCETYVLIQDNLFSLCEPSDPVTVTGQILTKDGQPVQGVNILGAFEFPLTTTDEEGRYTITAAPNVLTTIQPQYNDDYINGVDINDLYSAHPMVLNFQDFPPYSRIAADLNMSGNVGTFDLVLLNKLILGISTDFPAPSWRFIDADYVFPDPNNPWLEAFPEVININNPSTDTVIANFIGIKIGDVDCSANPNLPEFNQQLVHGKLFHDSNENCLIDSTEQGISDWIIKVQNDSLTLYTSTFAGGEYSLPVPEGNYTLTAIPASNIWDLCVNEIPISVTQGTPVEQNFPVISLINTPYMEVDISSLSFRRCESSSYIIQYCNLGNASATVAYVEVTFDDFITVNGSSIPWSAIQGQTYTFNLGEVAPGDCGNFSISFDISCDAVLGQTHCTEAHIYPDTLYIDPSSEWDGASLQVSSNCDADSVRFEIKNLGQDMQSHTQYIVIEDDLIMNTGTLKLASGERKFISQPANGATKRIQVEQTPGHPGENQPTAAVEACGTNHLGEFSLGFVSMFPNGDDDPFIAIECRENIGAFDPNDKQGFPKGRTTNHYIENTTELEYMIRFQNTGTDFARDVIIRDTLDTGVLDPTAIRPGSSSHNYEYFLSGEGIISFFFQDIMLPDSNANEPESHGFVKFRIRQQANNPDGTLIENNAAIYFDFNEPVITNYTLHTIGFPYEIAQEASIEGRVRRPNDMPISGVTATLQPTGLTQITDADGHFTFENLPTEQAYTIDFEKDDNPINGLTTYDLVLAAKHILGTSPLNPYQLVAADINQSQSLTVLDMVFMRKIILNIPGALEGIEPWLFIDGAHSFSNPANPWEDGLPIGISIDNLIANTAVDVIGIRIGDISGNSIPFTSEESPQGRYQTDPVVLAASLKKIENTQYQLDIRTTQSQKLAAYQFGLTLPSGWRIKNIRSSGLPGLTKEHFFLEENRLSTCWYQAEDLALAKGSLLFSLMIEIPSAKALSLLDDLKLNEALNRLAYRENGQRSLILLSSELDNPENQLYLFPNPGKENISISTYLAEEAEVSLAVFGLDGRKIFDLLSCHKVEKGWLNQTLPEGMRDGVYLVKLSTGRETVVKKLILLQ